MPNGAQELLLLVLGENMIKGSDLGFLHAGHVPPH